MSQPDIHLYTASAMNEWKPVVFLEEAGVEYELTYIDFSKREQKSEWYMQLNPNGLIPTIVFRSNDNFVVIESGAILFYLAQKYDKFLSHDAKERSETLQWVMFQMAGIGPMMGRATYFQRIAAANGHEDEFAIKRYVDESRRLLEVLNTRLTGRDWLVGNAFSIADITTYTWARAYYSAKVSVDGLPNLQAWLNRIDQREATQRALTIPKPYWAFFGKGMWKRRKKKTPPVSKLMSTPAINRRNGAMQPTFVCSCDCGATQVGVTGNPLGVGYCHCNDCRELLNVAFYALTGWDPCVMKGEEATIIFQYPHKHMTRVYCGRCGDVL